MYLYKVLKKNGIDTSVIKSLISSKYVDILEKNEKFSIDLENLYVVASKFCLNLECLESKDTNQKNQEIIRRTIRYEIQSFDAINSSPDIYFLKLSSLTNGNVSWPIITLLQILKVDIYKFNVPDFVFNYILNIPNLEKSFLRIRNQKEDFKQKPFGTREINLIDTMKHNNLLDIIIILRFNPLIAFINVKGNKSFLHYAAKYCNENILFSIIVKNYYYVDTLDDMNMTPLFYSVKSGRYKNTLLLTYFNSNLHHVNSFGENVVSYAVRRNQLQTLKVLCLMQVSVNNQSYGRKQTSLMLLILLERHPAFLSCLLKLKPDISLEDYMGNNVFHIAASKKNYYVYLKKLVLHTMNLEILNKTNKYGETPFFIACKNNNYASIKLLLECGINATILNNEFILPMNVLTDVSCKSLFKRKDIIKINPNYSVFNSKDYTKGLERIPVILSNNINNELPIYFKYITRNIYSKQIKLNTSIRIFCNCKGDCINNKNCNCAKASFDGKHAYKDGRIKYLNRMKDGQYPVIYECNKKCKCSENCGNRVVQKGLNVLLKLFKTKTMGFGIMLDETIESGSFIVEYIGKICSNYEANLKKNDDYLYDILSPTNVNADYCIDSFKNGNISRFINHSCDPNLFSVNVFHDHQDCRLPHICIFSTKALKKDSQLYLDYGDAFWEKKDFKCKCKFSECLYN